MSYQRKNQSGFTVVELLITIAISGVIIPALAVGLTNLSVLNNQSRDLALVNMIAQNKIELLRSAGFNSLTVGTTTFTSELPNTLTSPKSATYVVSTPSTGIDQVDINVSYTSFRKSRTITYRTYISEIGVGQ